MANWQNTLWSFITDFTNILYLNILFWINRASFHTRTQKMFATAFRIQAKRTQSQKMRSELNAEIVRTNGNLSPEFMTALQKKYFIQKQPSAEPKITEEPTQIDEMPKKVQDALEIVNAYSLEHNNKKENINETQLFENTDEENQIGKPMKVQ